MIMQMQYVCTSPVGRCCQRRVPGGKLLLPQWPMVRPSQSRDREAQLPEALLDDEPLIDKGLSLPLRLLALLGALAFVMLGVSSVVMPLLQQPGPAPMPDQRDRDRSANA